MLLHLHLKAGFAFVDSIGGLASRPQVGEALHGQRRGAVTIPGHLKVQVAVVCRENTGEKRHLIIPIGSPVFLEPRGIQM